MEKFDGRSADSSRTTCHQSLSGMVREENTSDDDDFAGEFGEGGFVDWDGGHLCFCVL